jgi:GTP pyrophosphokinase
VSEGTDDEAEEIPAARPVKLFDRSTSAVVVQGRSDVWVKLAMCCTPAPGDQVIGFVTRGLGVSVHRTDCPNVKSLQKEPERMIEVSWRPGVSTSFLVTIQVEALDRTKLLGDVATVLADMHVNIKFSSTSTSKDLVSTLRFTFELADIAHLSGVLAATRRIDGVFDAYRVVPR